MTLPAIIYVFVFSYLPMYGIQIAFKDFSAKSGIWGSHWVGLKHFIRFITFPNFTLLLKNTFRIGVYTLATFPCAIVFALLVNEVRSKRFSKSVLMASYLPHFLSTVVVCSIITLLLNRNTGVINIILSAFGVTPKDYLTIPSYFDDIYVWSDIWTSLGWDSIIYLAALSGVDNNLVEAAKMDGANRLQIIRHIYIPHIKPIIIIMLLVSCGHVLSIGFEKAFLLQNPLNLSASQIISTYVYEIGVKGGQFSYSTAIGLFNNTVNIMILLIVNRFSKRISGTSIW